MKPVDDGNVSSSSLEVNKEMGNGAGNVELKKWNRDLTSLPNKRAFGKHFSSKIHPQFFHSRYILHVFEADTSNCLGCSESLPAFSRNKFDNSNSITCFLILAREPIIPRTDGPFKIESRPQRKRPLRVVDDSNHGTAKYFDYLFYIDFEASMAEPRAQSALVHLQEYATFLRVLGSYPMNVCP